MTTHPLPYTTRDVLRAIGAVLMILLFLWWCLEVDEERSACHGRGGVFVGGAARGTFACVAPISDGGAR